MQTATLDRQFRELLRKHVLFSVLTDEQLQELLEDCEVVSHSIGEIVVEDGADADCAFLVYSGRVRVYKDAEGKQVSFGAFGPGDLFGEQAMLEQGKRTASVRAAEDTVLVKLERAAFQRLLDRQPDLRPFFEKLIDDYAVQRFLRLTTFVAAAPPKQVRKLLEKLERRSFGKGETVFQQGEPGDRLYLIRQGTVAVTAGRGADQRTLNTLGPGDYFGELALLEDKPRTATVIAVEDVQCLTLDRQAFQELVGSAPEVREQLAKRIEMYRVQDELEKKFGVRASQLQPRQTLSYDQAQPRPEVPQPRGTGPRRRPWSWLRRYPYLRQLDETDCGAASLAMISRYYGVSLRIGWLRDLANVGREGASLYSLSAAAEKLGYSTRAVKADYESLLGLELPAIGHWMGYHYIVVYRATPKYVVVGDPAVGLIRLTRKEFEAGWTGRLLLLSPTDALYEHKPAKTTFARFVPYVLSYRWLLLEIFLASVVLELFQLVSPVFTQTIVDQVLVHQNVNMLNIMLGGMLIVGVFQALTSILRQYLSLHVSQKLGLRLSSDLFRNLLKLPLRFFHSRKIGDLLRRFEDNNQIQQVLTGKVISTTLDVLTMFFTLGMMLYYNVQLTLVALVAIPAYIVLTLIFTPILKRNNIRMFERQAAASSSLIEALNSIETIKTSTAENPVRWKHEELIVKEEKVQFQGARVGMLLDGLSSAIQLFATTFLLWYGAHLVIQGKLTVGQLMAFQSLVGMVITPIMGLVGLWDELQEAFLSLQRLADVYDAEPEQPAGGSAVALPRLRGGIRLENVSFRYNLDDPPILSELNLEIPAGSSLAIVGRSGSGKTTLINLLQRFYPPSGGRILVDGYDLGAADVHSLRRQLGVVPQRPSIFSGTIRENIALGEPDASLERITAAAKIANAHDFITGFPLGYDTVIGEMGIQLSGGQQQRLAIARCLLRDPRIIIFDEATSALDTESERMIQQNMGAILMNRTALIIAHRMSTVQNADKIIVLDKGVIVEEGKHAELLERRGLYYYLNTQQLSL